MGNGLIKVCRPDGRLRYYQPPVCVMDILKDYSECVLVSTSKGNTNIISSYVELMPGGKYYLVPPDALLSTTRGVFQMPSDHRCVCRYKPFVRIVETSFFSAASLLGTVISVHKPNRKMLCTMVRAMGSLKFDLQYRPGCGRQTRSDDDMGAEVKSRGKSRAPFISPLTPSPASYATPRQKTPFKELKCVVPEVQSTPNLDKAGGKASTCWSSLIQLLHGNVGNAEDDVSSKEKWLEDMLRGADNQWRRLKLEHAFMIEDFEGADSPRLRVNAISPWAVCLPSSSRSPWTSTSRKDEYLSPLSTIEDSGSPSPRTQQTSQEFSNIVEIHPDPSNVMEIHQDQKLKREDCQEGYSLRDLILKQDSHGVSARRSVIKEVSAIDHMGEKQLTLQQEGLHAASRRRAAIAVLQLEIEAEESEDKSKPLLKQKMDEMERLSLLKPSPSPPLGSGRNFLQKYVQKADALLSNYTRLRKGLRYDWSPT